MGFIQFLLNRHTGSARTNGGAVANEGAVAIASLYCGWLLNRSSKTSISFSKSANSSVFVSDLHTYDLQQYPIEKNNNNRNIFNPISPSCVIYILYVYFLDFLRFFIDFLFCFLFFLRVFFPPLFDIKFAKLPKFPKNPLSASNDIS